MDWELDDPRPRYRLCQAGFGLIALALGLLSLDAGLDVVTAHDIATSVQHRLLHDVPKLVGATVHVGPDAPAWVLL